MSKWGPDDLDAEDYDENKDYSVQVKRQDGGLASTQVNSITKPAWKRFPSVLSKVSHNLNKLALRRPLNYSDSVKYWLGQRIDWMNQNKHYGNQKVSDYNHYLY